MSTTADSLPLYLWIGGLAVTMLGLGLYVFAANSRTRSRSFYSWMVLAWLFIPVFPLVFVLGAFPGSTAEGSLLEFKIGGAFASYVLLWFGGITFTARGIDTDAERQRVAKLEEVAAYVAVIKPIVEQGEPSKPLLETDTFDYLVRGTSRRVSIVTGDLAHVRGIDVWVNSENTNMQMARFGDRSVSSMIRYLGATKSAHTGLVEEDTIARLLAEQLGTAGQVAPAFVVATDSGELARTHGVRRLFHVAAVTGERGSGYRPIGRIQDCVTNCLLAADAAAPPDGALKAILFPLMGTGTGQGHLEENVELLLKTAITYFLQHDATTTLERACFLVRTDLDLAVCRKVLAGCDKVALVA
jgi:O-acetyl-ADP-ribose deacetylase (regulator of RNase III)